MRADPEVFKLKLAIDHADETGHIGFSSEKTIDPTK